jgi:hypothetical protein
MKGKDGKYRSSKSDTLALAIEKWGGIIETRNGRR